MLKGFFCALIVIFADLGALADFVQNSDENTLWIENGGNIAVEEKAGQCIWGGGLPIKAKKGGGFSFVFNPATPKKYANGIYVPVDPAYPYLVFEIEAFKLLKGHRGLTFGSFQGVKQPSFFMVSNPKPGLVVYNAFGETPPKKGYCFLRNDMDGLQVDFKYVKMVKLPNNSIIVQSEAMAMNKTLTSGDEIKFTVRLKGAAEDVSLRFFNAYGMGALKLNGRPHLQLKCEGQDGKKDGKTWSGTVKTASFSGFGEKADYPAGHILLKATVLGGEIHVPIWTFIRYPYKATIRK